MTLLQSRMQPKNFPRPYAVSQKIYQQNPGAAGAGADASIRVRAQQEAAAKDDVYDADYKVVDEEDGKN